jgi:hypothetical protein
MTNSSTTTLECDSCYTDRLVRTVCDAGDQWLERWSGIPNAPRSGSLLEIGCGGGRDTRYLTDLGLKVPSPLVLPFLLVY